MLNPYQKSLSKMFTKIAKYTFFLYVFIYLSLHLFIYLFIYLFICLFTWFYLFILIVYSVICYLFIYFYKKQKTSGKILEKVSAFLVSINC